MSIFAYKENDGTVNVAAFGKVTHDAEAKETQNGTKVKFSVAYGKKKYLNCEAWADRPEGELAMCLEQGDTVMVAGIHRSWEYNGQQYSSLSVDYVSPMYAPQEATSEPPAEQTEQAAPQRFSEIDDADEEIPF